MIVVSGFTPIPLLTGRKTITGGVAAGNTGHMSTSAMKFKPENGNLEGEKAVTREYPNILQNVKIQEILIKIRSYIFFNLYFDTCVVRCKTKLVSFLVQISIS